MKIVSLAHSLSELVAHFDQAERLLATPHQAGESEPLQKLPDITVTRHAEGTPQWLRNICAAPINVELLKTLKPELILCMPAHDGATPDDKERAADRKRLSMQFSEHFGFECRVEPYYARRLDDMYELFEQLGSDIGAAARGRQMAGRAKAQLMDWADNFYDRTKNKKVAVVTSVEPFTLAGRWVPDIIALLSAQSMAPVGRPREIPIKWDDVLKYRPDVMLIATEAPTILESMRSFKQLEKLPEWETVPAVKRGEVFFALGGPGFFAPTPKILDSAAILLSAIAGLDSGYITERDSMYRLRWLEMQRHRF